MMRWLRVAWAAVWHPYGDPPEPSVAVALPNAERLVLSGAVHAPKIGKNGR